MLESETQKKEELKYERLKYTSDNETNVINDNLTENNYNSSNSKENMEKDSKPKPHTIKSIVRDIRKTDLLLKNFQTDENKNLFSNLKRSSTLDNWKARKSSDIIYEDSHNLNQDSNASQVYSNSNTINSDANNKMRNNLKKSKLDLNNYNKSVKKVSTDELAMPVYKKSNVNIKENVDVIFNPINNNQPIMQSSFKFKDSKRKGFTVKGYSTSIIKLDKYFQFIKQENKEKRKKQFTKKRIEILIKFAFYVISNIVNIFAVFNYIIQTFFDDRPENEEINLFLTYIELSFTFYFLFEYMFICYKIKGSYFKHILSIDSFIDMITIIPSIITYFISFRGVKLNFIRVFRIFRVFRILRIYKSLKMIQVESSSQDEENNKSNSKLIKFDPIKLQFMTIVVILVCVFFIGAGLVLGVNDIVQDAFTLKTFNFLDATYFMIVTYCTLGYGDILPITISTRFMIIIGLFCLFVIVSDQLTRLANLLKFWGPGLIHYTGVKHIIIIADKSVNLKLFIETLSYNKEEKVDFIIISKDIHELPTNRYPFEKAILIKKDDIDLELLDLINLKKASAVFIFSTKTNYYCERYDKITDFFFMKITQNYLTTPPIYLQTLNSDKTITNSNNNAKTPFNLFSRAKPIKEKTLKNLKRAIPIWKIKSLIISKCTFNPGFATFIQNLLFNDYQIPVDIENQSEVLQNYMRGCENKICVHKLPNFFSGKNFYDAMYIVYFKSINDYFVKVNIENEDTNRPILLIGVYENDKLGLAGNDNIEIFPNDYLIGEGSYGIFISYNENDYIENNLYFFNEEYEKKINKKLVNFNNANNSNMSSNYSGNSENISRMRGNFSELAASNQLRNQSLDIKNNNSNLNITGIENNFIEKKRYSFIGLGDKPDELGTFNYHKTLSEKKKNNQINNSSSNIFEYRNSSSSSLYRSSFIQTLNNNNTNNNLDNLDKRNFMEDNKDFMGDNKFIKRNSANFNNIYYKFAQGVFNRFSTSLQRNNSNSKFIDNNPIKEEIGETSRDETKYENKIDELTEKEITDSESEKDNNDKNYDNNNSKNDIEIYDHENIKIYPSNNYLNKSIKISQKNLSKIIDKNTKRKTAISSKNILKTSEKISLDLFEEEKLTKEELASKKHLSEKNLHSIEQEDSKITEEFYKRMFKNMNKRNSKNDLQKQIEIIDNESKLSKNNDFAEESKNTKNKDSPYDQKIKKIETLDLELNKNGINYENMSEIFMKNNNEFEDKNLKIPEDFGYINSFKSNNNDDLIKIDSYNHFFCSEKDNSEKNKTNDIKQLSLSKLNPSVNSVNNINNNSHNTNNNQDNQQREQYLVLNDNITNFAKQIKADEKAQKESLIKSKFLRSKTHNELFDKKLIKNIFSNEKENEKQYCENDLNLTNQDYTQANDIFKETRFSQKNLVKNNFKLSVLEQTNDKDPIPSKKPSKKYSGFIEQFAQMAEKINLEKTKTKKSIAKPYKITKANNNNRNKSVNTKFNSVNNTSVRSNTAFLNLFELGFVHENNFKNRNTVKNLEFLNEGDNTIKDIFFEKAITNEKINLKANKLFTNLTEKDELKSIITRNSKKHENTKLIEFNIFDIEKDDLSQRFRNHIIIIGCQDILSKLLKLIYLHQEKDICIISTPDSDEVFIHKLLKQYDNLFYFKGSPENPFHLLNAGLNNAYLVVFLTENLFGKTNEDMQKILIYKSIDYFFNTRMILELWSSKSCRLLGNVPLRSNGEVEPNEFFNPAFMAGRLIYLSHLEKIIAKSYTEETNTEVWFKLINLGLVTRYEKGHKTIYNNNLNNEGMPIILTLEIPAMYNDREYYNLVDDLMKLNPPALPVGIYIESPLDYLRLRSRGNVKRDKSDTGLFSQINITTSHKKKLVNLHKMDKIDKTYLGNLKVLRDISYNDKVFLDIVDLNNSYMPMFITNPHPGFIISSKCKVMVIYYHVTNKDKSRLKDFKLKRTIGIKNTTKNQFKKETSIGDEFRQKQEMLKHKQEKIFGYYEILKRKLVDNIEKKYSHIVKDLKMKNGNFSEQTDSNIMFN